MPCFLKFLCHSVCSRILVHELNLYVLLNARFEGVLFRSKCSFMKINVLKSPGALLVVSRLVGMQGQIQDYISEGGSKL